MSQQDEFIRQVIEHLYSGQSTEFGAGFGTQIVSDNVGFIVVYSDESIKCSAGVLSGLALSWELCEQVAEINKIIPMGALYLHREGTTNDWCLIYYTKIRRAWIDPSSDISIQMTLDILGNIPGLLNMAVDYFEKQMSVPVSRWNMNDDQWWFFLLDRT